MSFLYHAHSGLRYLVILAGIVALLVLAYGAMSGKPMRASRGVMSAFTGLLDLQILLGIGVAASGIWYGALIGHLSMMIVAAVFAHVTGVMARKTTDERRATRLRLIGVVGALVCIALGITAIGRGIFTSAPPSVGTHTTS